MTRIALAAACLLSTLTLTHTPSANAVTAGGPTAHYAANWFGSGCHINVWVYQPGQAYPQVHVVDYSGQIASVYDCYYLAYALNGGVAYPAD